MTDEHKEALAKGRKQARAVRDYLTALEAENAASGRLDEDELEQRLGDLQDRLSSEDDKATRVELQQRKLDYEQRLERLRTAGDLDQLQKDFVDAVIDYSTRRGISYMAWREEGVPAAVLKEAGMKRSYAPPGEE